MSSKVFHDAERQQTSVLAPLERAALRGLARRMPAWVNSDHLSLLGFVAMFLAGVFYAASGRNPMLLHVVNLCIFLNWFGDSLDGTLARYRDRQRPRYGFYVDHIIDTFGTTFVIVGLAMSGYISERVAAGALIVFLMLAINSYLATYTLGVFKISHGKLGPTEIRLVLIVGNLVLLNSPYTRIFGRQFLLFDVGGVVSMIGMASMLVVSSIKNTHTLYKLEPLPALPPTGSPTIGEGLSEPTADRGPQPGSPAGVVVVGGLPSEPLLTRSLPSRSPTVREGSFAERN